MKNKRFKPALYVIGLFFLFSVVHCYIFRPGVFYNRYVTTFILYILFYMLLSIIALIIIPKLNSLQKMIFASLICPYLLAGFMGTVYFIFNPTNIDELIAFALYAPYIGMGCYVGTIPFAISCFFYSRKKI